MASILFRPQCVKTVDISDDSQNAVFNSYELMEIANTSGISNNVYIRSYAK